MIIHDAIRLVRDVLAVILMTLILLTLVYAAVRLSQLEPASQGAPLDAELCAKTGAPIYCNSGTR